MVRTRSSEAASSSARPWPCWTHDPFQDAQGIESNPEEVMKDVGRVVVSDFNDCPSKV